MRNKNLGSGIDDFLKKEGIFEEAQRNFALPPERWKAFLRALDSPPVIKPQLKKLFSEASVLEVSR